MVFYKKTHWVAISINLLFNLIILISEPNTRKSVQPSKDILTSQTSFLSINKVLPVNSLFSNYLKNVNCSS